MNARDVFDKLLKKGCSTELTKNDKIRCVSGDLMNIKGVVVSIDNNLVNFTPIGIEGFTDNLQVDVKHVVKLFEPGDNVRVIEGPNKGETGIVTDIEQSFVIISLEQSTREIKVFANNLKMKSELD